MMGARGNGESGTRDPEIMRAEAEIARTREEVALRVAALQREISRNLDWYEWIRQRPFVALALAFGAGVVLGSWRPSFHRRGT